MISFDHASLAQSLLEGDWDARWILADLLYEAGDDELAEFARNARRVNREGDLHLAIRLLPIREAIALGCALVDRGMTGKGTVRRHAWLLARLARVRRLVRKGAPPDHFAAEGRSLVNYRVAGSVGRDDHSLEDAAQSLGTALEQAESARAVGAAIANVARAMRRRTGYLSELEWQVERARQIFARLIESATDELYALP
jgi:hypothetical protein